MLSDFLQFLLHFLNYSQLNVDFLSFDDSFGSKQLSVAWDHESQEFYRGYRCIIAYASTFISGISDNESCCGDRFLELLLLSVL